MMGDDWAKKKFEELKAKEGAAHEKSQQRFVERHQLLADAPILWRELRRILQKRLSEFNQLRPGYLTLLDLAGTSNTETLTIASPKGELDLTFDPNSPRIEYLDTKQQGVRGAFIFVSMGSNVVAMKKEDSGVPVPPGDVAEFLLNFLVLSKRHAVINEIVDCPSAEL